MPTVRQMCRQSVRLCPRDVAPDDHFADLLASLHCSHQLMGQPEARTPHAADLLGMRLGVQQASKMPKKS